MAKFIGIATVLHVNWYINFGEFFSICTKFGIFQKSSVKYQFFYRFMLSLLCSNEEKWKKSWEIKLGLGSILEHCASYTDSSLVQSGTATVFEEYW